MIATIIGLAWKAGGEAERSLAGRGDRALRDAEILVQFDGRGRAEFLLGGFEAMISDKIAAFASELGYELHEMDFVTRGQYRLIYFRDDSPDVRQRAQGTLDRLRAGGALFLPQRAFMQVKP
ncbi:hypothetical protein ACWZEH_18725 [Streptomyces sp. QTS137]